MSRSAPAVARPRPWLAELYTSAVGKRYAMAITGIVALGYVFAHMVGNLKIYFADAVDGTPALDTYGHWLRDSLGYPVLPHSGTLWVVRIVLIAALVVHVHAAYALTVMNRNARPDAYRSKRDYVVADFAARTMRWTGVIVLLFLLYHLANFTWGVEAVNPAFVRGNVYDNVVASFSRPAVAVFYVVAQLAFGVHIYHGAWSMFQSLGINNRRFNRWRRHLAIGLTLVVVIPNVSIPVAVTMGVVG